MLWWGGGGGLSPVLRLLPVYLGWQDNKNAVIIDENLKYPHFLQGTVRNRMTKPWKSMGCSQEKMPVNLDMLRNPSQGIFSVHSIVKQEHGNHGYRKRHLNKTQEALDACAKSKPPTQVFLSIKTPLIPALLYKLTQLPKVLKVPCSLKPAYT